MIDSALIQHVLEMAGPYITRYGYAAVFGSIFVEGFGIPAPGMSLLVAGAVLASRGELHIVPLLLVAWSAAVIGDNIGYALGRHGGRRLVFRLGIGTPKLERAERFFQRRGSWIVATARFFDVLRQLNGIAAGIGGMTWRRFFLYDALGATAWVGLWGWGVYHLGLRIESGLSFVKTIEPYVIGAAIAALGVVLVYFVRGRSARRPEK